MGFEVIQLHCLNIYYSALTWIPRRSIIREHYKESLYIHRVVGLPDSWGPSEHVLHHPSRVWSAAFSPDGSQIVSGSDETIRVWRATTGEIERELRGHSEEVNTVAFSSDGRRIVTGSNDKTVRVWRVADWKVEHVLEGHSGVVQSIAFSPDGTCVVSGSHDMTVRVWVVDAGEIKWVLEGHSDEVWSVAFSHSHIASGSDDHTIRIWDAHTGETVRVLAGHSTQLYSIAFSSNGSRLVSGSLDAVWIWDTHTWESVRRLDGKSFSLAFSFDGHHLVSGYRTVRIWNADTGDIEHEINDHPSAVSSVAFSHDDSCVVFASDAGIRTWNMETQRVPEYLSHPMNNHTRRISDTVRVTTMMEPCIIELDSHSVHCLAFSPDGGFIVSASDRTIRLCSTSTAEVVHVLRHSCWMNCVVFSSCGRRVVSGSSDNAVHIWSTITGQKESVLKGHSRYVSCVAFSPCDTRVASGSYDQTVRIWNVTSGEVELVLSGHSDYVSAVAFSHDGSRVTSGSMDGTFGIWNLVTGEAEWILKGHQDRVTCIAFSHDTRRVVSGYIDGTIKVWDVMNEDFTESCELLGGCRVNDLGHGRFQILDPVNQNVTIQASLSSDLKWLLGGSQTHDCCIPSEYCNRVMALSGSNVCIGYDDGQVAIIDLATRFHKD